MLLSENSEHVKIVFAIQLIGQRERAYRYFFAVEVNLFMHFTKDKCIAGYRPKHFVTTVTQ